MATDGLLFPAPLQKRPAFSTPDYELRDQAIAKFEKSDVFAALHHSLRYVNPRAGRVDLRRAPLRWVQGTAEVEIRLDEDNESDRKGANTLVVQSSLLQCPQDQRNPAALRYFLKSVSNTGQLFQPRLRGDALSLEFRERLSLLHPQKLIEVLQKLPGIADSHDDWLHEELGTPVYQRATIKKLSAKESARAISFWRSHWQAMDSLLMESRRRRSIHFLDAIGRIAINHVSCVLPLYGSLRRRLTQASDIFTDRDEKPRERENELARCIKQMLDINDADLLSCTGHLQFAISPWSAGSADVLRSAIGGVNHMHQTNELRLTGRHLEAGVGLVANYLYLLAYFIWPKPVEAELRAALDVVSGKSWRVISDQLWLRAQAIARRLDHNNNDAGDMPEDSDEQ